MPAIAAKTSRIADARPTQGQNKPHGKMTGKRRQSANRRSETNSMFDINTTQTQTPARGALTS
jgi:hypothetical protein